MGLTANWEMWMKTKKEMRFFLVDKELGIHSSREEVYESDG